MPRLERGKDRRQDDESGACCAEETANHRPPERRALLSAFAEAQRHRHHPGQHRETCHQDRTQTAPCAFYCRLPWLTTLDPAALSESHEQDGICHGHADRHDRAHEGLNVERGPGEPKHEYDSGDDGRNRRPHRQGKPERLEVGGQQQEDDPHRHQESQTQASEHLRHRLDLHAGGVPVGDLVFSSKTKTVAELQDAALFKVRPLFATLPGVSAPPPFGSSQRTILVRVDPAKLRSYNMSPDEVVQALAAGNTVSPSGNVRIGDLLPMVPVNSVVGDFRGLNNIPIRSQGTQTIFIRDVGSVEDGADIQTGYALVDGRRTVYIPVTKRADASTLAVVQAVKANLPRFQSVLPDDVEVSYQFDQSPYVTRAIQGLFFEGALGAVLTGLMVLLFLRDWRSSLVVALNIPLAILASVTALWVSGQTINIMTLGGLPLSA